MENKIKNEISYFFYLDTLDKDDYDYDILTIVNLVEGDIITFRNEYIGKDFEKIYKTEYFIIEKRIFILDSDLENIGGVCNLLIKPYNLK